MSTDYKKYSLEQLDNWVNDALSCEQITPQEIYDTVVDVVQEVVDYHQKNLDKGNQLLDLFKSTSGNITIGDASDLEKFWNEQYTNEELTAMCDAAEQKERNREYNLREAEYYTKRAKLDAFERSKYYWDRDRNK